MADLIPAAALTLRNLELELGGRDAVVQALVTAPQSKDVRYVLGLLADPRNARKSLAEICLLGKILPGQLLELMERGMKVRARIISGQIIAEGTPAMVRDVMKRAAPHEDACTNCQGLGTVVPEPTPEDPNPSPLTCPLCRGGARLLFDADPECRKLGLEMAGLTAKGGGINIINQNANVQQAPAIGVGFDTIQEVIDRVLYGRGSVVDGETVADAGDPADEADE